jgi:hypothetical protein
MYLEEPLRLLGKQTSETRVLGKFISMIRSLVVTNRKSRRHAHIFAHLLVRNKADPRFVHVAALKPGFTFGQNTGKKVLH